VVGKEISVKKYVVRLSAEEHAQLDELIRKGKRSAQLLTKARILLKAEVSERAEGCVCMISGHPRAAQTIALPCAEMTRLERIRVRVGLRDTAACEGKRSSRINCRPVRASCAPRLRKSRAPSAVATR
jgi:hypothetical protein